MDEKTKEALRAANAETDRRTDLLLGAVVASPYTWAFLLGFGLVCFLLGVWAMR